MKLNRTLLLTLLAIGGWVCSVRAQQPAAEINPVALDNAVMSGSDRMVADTLGLASSIARSTDDRAVREMTVRMKIRVSEIADAVQRETDPRQRFVLLWTYTEQFRQFLTSNAHDRPFGDKQDAVSQFADQLIKRVEAIGLEFYTSEQIDAARDDIEQMADASRASSFLMRPVAAVRSEDLKKKSDLGTILLRPLTPLSGVSSGMTDAASAMNRFSDVAATGISASQRLPQRVRWEMELLLLEFDSLQSVTAIVEQMRGARQDLRKATEMIEQFPKKTRLEVDQSVQTVTDALPRLEQTLASAQKTIEQLNETVKQSEKLSQNVSQTLGTVSAAGKDWALAAREVRTLLEQYEAMNPTKDEQAEAFDWKQVTETAQSVRQASAELRLLLSEMQTLAQSQEMIGSALAEARQAAAESVDRAGDRADTLIDKITNRVIVILAIFTAVWWTGQWWLKRRAA